ncbi:MAG: alpha/beta hydrolase [Opitutales bacterium]|nr:alpha/beta hydrolase [Opitutales bacterium]
MSHLWVIRFFCLFGLAYSYGQAETSELIQTDLRENGQTIRLELVTAKPDGDCPFPTLVFNHGSTGTGSDPNLFKLTWWSEEIAEFFNEQGWMVVFPQRRGRGRSDGLYDEGFTQNRSGYTCDSSDSLEGMERALTDIDEVVAHLKLRPEVLPSRMMIGSQSRGGILSVVYAGTRPDAFDGVINFVGGWMSDSCSNPQLINTVSFRRGAQFPHKTLWLYGLNDPFYSLSHSRSNFDAFIQAGGKGEFKTITPFSGFNGHGIIFTPDLWRNSLAAYLDELPNQPIQKYRRSRN